MAFVPPFIGFNFSEKLWINCHFIDWSKGPSPKSESLANSSVKFHNISIEHWSCFIHLEERDSSSIGWKEFIFQSCWQFFHGEIMRGFYLVLWERCGCGWLNDVVVCIEVSSNLQWEIYQRYFYFFRISLSIQISNKICEIPYHFFKKINVFFFFFDSALQKSRTTRNFQSIKPFKINTTEPSNLYDFLSCFNFLNMGTFFYYITL